MLRSSISAFFLLLASISYGQNLILVDSTQISQPVAASIDRLNNIYIADEKGNLHQYFRGKLNHVFSPQKSGEITLIEASNPLKIFLFYKDFQEYVFLDRFLTGSERYSVPDLAGFSMLSTVSNDNNLWIIDAMNFSLKKYNIHFREFTSSTPFHFILDQKDHEITFIREYQNLVFISEQNSGILVFDNLGNFMERIPTAGVNYFSFDKESLIYLAGDQLKAVDIYNKRETIYKLPEKGLFAFRFDDKIALITKNALKIYKVKI